MRPTGTKEAVDLSGVIELPTSPGSKNPFIVKGPEKGDPLPLPKEFSLEEEMNFDNSSAEAKILREFVSGLLYGGDPVIDAAVKKAGGVSPLEEALNKVTGPQPTITHHPRCMVLVKAAGEDVMVVDGSRLCGLCRSPLVEPVPPAMEKTMSLEELEDSIAESHREDKNKSFNEWLEKRGGYLNIDWEDAYELLRIGFYAGYDKGGPVDLGRDHE